MQLRTLRGDAERYHVQSYSPCLLVVQLRLNYGFIFKKLKNCKEKRGSWRQGGHVGHGEPVEARRAWRTSFFLFEEIVSWVS